MTKVMYPKNKEIFTFKKMKIKTLLREIYFLDYLFG